jgi:hypothetical protein
MHIAAVAIILWSQVAFSVSDVVVAKPEVSGGNLVHVGETLVIPLYDGELSPGSSVQGLRFVGKRRIHKHDLIQDVGRAAFGGYDAASDRGAAFVVEHSGRGTINVLLRLPQYKDRCSSCRTVHFFYRAL